MAVRRAATLRRSRCCLRLGVEEGGTYRRRAPGSCPWCAAARVMPSLRWRGDVAGCTRCQAHVSQHAWPVCTELGGGDRHLYSPVCARGSPACRAGHVGLAGELQETGAGGLQHSSGHWERRCQPAGHHGLCQPRLQASAWRRSACRCGSCTMQPCKAARCMHGMGPAPARAVPAAAAAVSFSGRLQRARGGPVERDGT